MIKYFLFIFCLPICLYSQSIEISIKDIMTKEAIIGSKLLHNNKPIGISDIQGKASVNISFKVIDITAIGYDTVEVVLGGERQTIYLTKIDKKIKEVKISPKSDSLAIWLVDRMKKNFENNHPDKLPSYQFLVYSKFVADAKEDSMKSDSVPKKMSKKDSAEKIEMQGFVKHSKLFVWEKASIFKHDINYGNKKVLINSKMSGFKQPIYELLALSLDEVNTIPRVFRDNNSKEYYFTIEDSFMLNNRKTYQVYFHPIRKYKTKRSRSGYVMIDAQNFALIKYQGTTKEGFAEITNQLIEGKCFSKEVFYNYTDVFFKINQFKSTTTYKLKVEQIETPKSFSKSEFKGNESDISASLGDDKSEKILNQIRGNDTMDSREANTFNSLDSIMDRENVQTKLKLILALRRGYVRLGRYFNLSINDLFQVNRYEGFRAQIGGTTSYELHPKISLNGYIAYGFKDEKFKEGLGLTYLMNYYNNSKITINYQNDVLPTGRSWNDLASPFMRVNQYANLLYFSNYYQTQNLKLSFQTDLNKYLEGKISTQISEVSTKFNYQFDGKNIQDLKLISTGIQVNYYPKSQFVTTPEGKFEVKSKPTHLLFHSQYHHPIQSSFSAYITNEFNFKTYFKSPIGGFELFVKGGLNIGNASIISLYEGNGNASSNSENYQSFAFSSNRHFSTMMPSTFYSDRYAMMTIAYSIPYFNILKKSIYPTIVYKSMLGELTDPTLHSNQLMAPSKLYQECGLEFRNLYANFGLGAFYRFGAYNTGNFGNNLATSLIVRF